MHSLKIKPFSVNDAWQGRRYRTTEYKKFEKDCLLLLNKKIHIPDGDLVLRLEFGFSSASSDWDNPIKPFQDVLQKRYGFNDKRVKLGIVASKKVKKGEEYIKFDIHSADDLRAD